MEQLTPRQQQVLAIVTAFIEEFGYPPSLRQIAAELEITGTLGVMKHLEALEKKGYIRRDGGSSRGIALIREQQPSMASIPIVGVVRAGLPALAVEDIEGFYPVEKVQLRGGAFFLRVKGDSMINDAILEGDLALIRPQSTAENGDIVVAMVGGEATLKRFYRERGRIRLQPANPNMDPIYVRSGEEVSIVGKVIKVIRDIA